MVKIIFFALIVLGVMVYPLLLEQKTNVQKKVFHKEFPELKFEKGKFSIYKGRLEKKGGFESFSKYKNGYVALRLNVEDLFKKETYKADKAVFKNETVTGYGVFYQNSDLTLLTSKALYDKTTKELKGEKFRLKSKDFRGEGKKFRVEDKNLYAEGITYFLKVEK